jgi:hypothetical protein
VKLPRVVHNWISYLGGTVATISFAVFWVLLILYMLTGESQPYAGLVLFILLPAVFAVGLLLIPVGMLVEWRHEKRTGRWSMSHLPVLDLNNSAHRNAAFVFILGSLFVALFAAFASYQGFRVTESTAFCGRLCHTVMTPEYAAYQDSPHARVACVDCHVGPGATWYVRSKLSGLHQVYAVLFHKYSQPISTPIESLRPAQETCQQCHWPSQFWGGSLMERSHFLSDSLNTPWNITLDLKIGGGNSVRSLPRGIHWHMSVNSRVEYFASDSARQQIDWVRYVDLAAADTTVYTAGGETVDPDTLPQGSVRVMDCIDCHNRPTHIFDSPDRAMDIALVAGRIDSNLPFVKRTGVRLLSAAYPSKDSALAAIAAGLRRFYRESDPSIASDRADAISDAIVAVQNIYSADFFPSMNVSWRVYPENDQHRDSRGCFRCHDGNHESADRKVVTHECSSCHAILMQGTPGEEEYATSLAGVPFRHPVDIGGMWQELTCDACHTGGGS